MRILVINLTRFGDLLQTQPLIHELNAAGHRIAVVCLHNFADAAGLLSGVERVFPLPGHLFLSTLSEDWRLALGAVEGWIDEVMSHFEAEEVLSLTASLSGRLLAQRLVRRPVRPRGSDGKAMTPRDVDGEALLRPEQGKPELPLGPEQREPEPLRLCGFGVDDHGFSLNTSLWASFFEASTLRRACSPYNLVDVFRKAAGYGQKPVPFDLRLPESAPLLEARPGGYIAFQLGASEARRQWPVASFAELGRRVVASCGLMPVLVGTTAERALADAYVGTGAPCVDLVGRTSLPSLASTLAQCRLLVTNDTGTMHLAAGLGIPCLAFFLATAQAVDTGPYLAGCCCLEPDLDCHPCAFGTQCAHEEQCRYSIRPELAFELVSAFAREGTWPQGGVRGARAWLTCHEDAFMDLRSLSGHDRAPRSLWLRMQRHMLRQFLDWDAENEARKRAEGVLADAPSFSPPPGGALFSSEYRERLCSQLDQGIALLHLLGEQGKMFALNPTDMAGRRFLGTVHRIGAYFDDSEDCNALGRMWSAAAQSRGDSLDAVLRLAEGLRALLVAWRAGF